MCQRLGIKRSGWSALAKNVEFKLNLPGLNEIMKSGGMQSVLNAAANSIASTAGDGYEAVIEEAHPISFIAIASVKTKNAKGRLDNNKNNTLLKASGGRNIV